MNRRQTGTCHRCGGECLIYICEPCAVARHNADREKRKKSGGPVAHRAVKMAIKQGHLTPITEDTKCVDCGAQARDYDHRDYSKPLEVEPVCRSCNIKRGPALHAS